MRGRGLSVVVIGMMIVSGLGALPASAQPQEGDVVATGHIAAGEPLTGFWASLWYGYPTEFHYLNGPHGFTFDVTGLAGLWLRPEVHDPTGAGYDVAIYYMDEAGRHIETERGRAPGSHALAEEPYGHLASVSQALVPAGAVTAFVYASLGFLLDVTVVVAAAPDPLPADVLAAGMVPVGVPKGQEALWILGGRHAPSFFSVAADVTDLNGALIVPEVVDHGGAGYELRMVFRTAYTGILTADCSPMPNAAHPIETGGIEFRWSESCVVPDGAVRLDAALYHGRDVDVTLRLA